MDGGYIYLIENVIGGETRYKIGYAKNLDKRLKQLETGNPGIMNIIKRYKSKWGRVLENKIHRKFSDNNIKNEWFILNQEQIDKFIIECEKSEQILDSMEDNYFFRKKYKL